MKVTKEAVQNRLEELRKKCEQLEADAIAVNGAVQDCQYWLTVLSQKDKE